MRNWLKLRNGPAEGSYFCARAPFFLRATVAGEKKDVLDLLMDKPEMHGEIHVYRQVSTGVRVHLCAQPRSASRYYEVSEYEHMANVDGDNVRSDGEWHQWVGEQPECEAREIDWSTGAWIKRK